MGGVIVALGGKVSDATVSVREASGDQDARIYANAKTIPLVTWILESVFVKEDGLGKTAMKPVSLDILDTTAQSAAHLALTAMEVVTMLQVNATAYQAIMDLAVVKFVLLVNLVLNALRNASVRIKENVIRPMGSVFAGLDGWEKTVLGLVQMEHLVCIVSNTATV